MRTLRTPTSFILRMASGESLRILNTFRYHTVHDFVSFLENNRKMSEFYPLNDETYISLRNICTVGADYEKTEPNNQADGTF